MPCYGSASVYLCLELCLQFIVVASCVSKCKCRDLIESKLVSAGVLSVSCVGNNNNPRLLLLAQQEQQISPFGSVVTAF